MTWSACANYELVNMCVSIKKRFTTCLGEPGARWDSYNLTYHQIQTYPELFAGHHLVGGVSHHAGLISLMVVVMIITILMMSGQEEEMRLQAGNTGGLNLHVKVGGIWLGGVVKCPEIESIRYWVTSQVDFKGLEYCCLGGGSLIQ